jgi:xanthine dehydrogenase YagR molybdenum-binding subunit
MDGDGRVIVRSDMTDIGTGTCTILAQIAAEALGVTTDRVAVELARTDLPLRPGSGGSSGALNTSNALHRACGAQGGSDRSSR